jgi:hypothetical protein
MNAKLKPAEFRLLVAYRIMDRRAKGQTLRSAQRQARNWPTGCGASMGLVAGAGQQFS